MKKVKKRNTSLSKLFGQILFTHFISIVHFNVLVTLSQKGLDSATKKMDGVTEKRFKALQAEIKRPNAVNFPRKVVEWSIAAEQIRSFNL